VVTTAEDQNQRSPDKRWNSRRTVLSNKAARVGQKTTKIFGLLGKSVDQLSLWRRTTCVAQHRYPLCSLPNSTVLSWLKYEKNLHHLAPERSFIAAKAVERAVIEVGEALEGVRQIAEGNCISI
jgi:hypothetical protein